MAILFQYINIKHLLGMYITKQGEQEIYLIAYKSDDSAEETKFDSRLSTFLEMALKKTAGEEKRRNC